MVGMFLFTLGQGASNRLLQECFQHSGETISQIFREVLQIVYLMSIDLIKPRENQFDTVPSRIRNDPKYRPFKDCIGAIDSTHIPTVIPKDERDRFIGRKGFTTQNVMAACDFDMLYIFISAGWEGSAHDARVFQDAITDESLHFPHPPPGKYYLVDAGYPNRIGYLAPYRGERYHSSQFENGRRASGPQEVFNHAHSSLRNVIERTFRVTKNRWPILRNMRSFPFPIQVKIVIACMALHNYIRLRVTDDDEFMEIDEEPSCSYEEGPSDATAAGNVGDSDLRDNHTMTRVRDLIANKLVRRRERN
ncbi:protein ALP1-like isoform X1 [Tripterygium wilfordii]|uniref:protein ALP1-like isoform X1 n=1 Tax=Tripterygium wilfordii TaxID=458696 RepID=UPI0018F7FAB3|nr:protein ALP1-like isoform X1 [Tripterygium wilfordii]XP_038679960.1 protein ALP1-like isoform X1 [Tripterygium wilfordii]XP_038679961.1 protein ALP1-like isoform X1 [Tripterygium wilfordii]XP_038679962.1 protein ALP1-like isoform X1 [Tripterygium wilfordii]